MYCAAAEQSAHHFFLRKFMARRSLAPFPRTLKSLHVGTPPPKRRVHTDVQGNRPLASAARSSALPRGPGEAGKVGTQEVPGSLVRGQPNRRSRQAPAQRPGTELICGMHTLIYSHFKTSEHLHNDMNWKRALSIPLATSLCPLCA